MKKKYFKKIILCLFLLIASFFFAYHWLIQSPTDQLDEKNIIFTIESGTSVKEIAANLKDQGLIRSEMAFYLYVKNQNLDQNIFSGNFNLKKSMNSEEILKLITAPSKADLSFTIQEGLRIKDIDQKLSNQGLITAGEFITSIKSFDQWGKYPFLNQNSRELPLEGYIYPDTYFIDPETFTSEGLIIRALNNFQSKINNLGLENNPEKLEKTIIMASIIENEVFGKEDRQIVSGIFWKRLENNWTLGADATLLYITEDRTITAADLAIDSKYNTRKNLGLPPGPISNPSIESIEAALNPSETPYWFYLTTPDTGEVIYAKTNEEHNLNREKHL